MKSTARLDQLQAMLAEEPGDVFLRYAIALELNSHGRIDEAIQWLDSLNRDAPEHVPTYYQLALLLAEDGRGTEALTACDAGAAQALIATDHKARAELIALKAAIEEEHA